MHLSLLIEDGGEYKTGGLGGGGGGGTSEVLLYKMGGVGENPINALTSIISSNLPFFPPRELCTIRFLIIH